MTVTLHVCITCRAGQPQLGDEPVAGARLYQALCGLPAPAGLRIAPVRCLSACAQGAAVALAGPGRWSLVHGRMGPCDAEQILAGAAAYAAAPDGIVPWRDRPAIFRQRALARIPPIG